MTTGVLKMMLIGDGKLANNFTHIIIDEVHERELDTDFLLAFLKVDHCVDFFQEFQYNALKILFFQNIFFSLDPFSC